MKPSNNDLLQVANLVRCYEQAELMHASSALPPSEIARRAGALRTGELLGRARVEWVGPSFCAVCGQWPALNAGRLCNSCDDIRHAHENPVPGGPEDHSPNSVSSKNGK